MSLIYLDNNATTVIHPEVANAMQACHQLGLVNPESQHQLGRQARRQLEDCREQLGVLLGLHLSDVHADHSLILRLGSGSLAKNNMPSTRASLADSSSGISKGVAACRFERSHWFLLRMRRF